VHLQFNKCCFSNQHVGVINPILRPCLRRLDFGHGSWLTVCVWVSVFFTAVPKTNLKLTSRRKKHQNLNGW
jgi:hypothetical protein